MPILWTKDSIIDGLRKAKHPAPLMPYALQCLCPECKEEGHVYDGRYFLAPSTRDINRLLESMRTWDSLKSGPLQDFWPKEEIPYGWQTHYWSIPDHGYTHWYRMFNPRQLLVHATTPAEDHDGEKAPAHQLENRLLEHFNNTCAINACIAFWDISTQTSMAPHFSNNNLRCKAVGD